MAKCLYNFFFFYFSSINEIFTSLHQSSIKIFKNSFTFLSMIEIRNSKFSSFFKISSNQQICHKIVKIQNSFRSSKFSQNYQNSKSSSRYFDKIFTKSNYQDSKSFSLLKTSFDLFSLLRSNFHKIVKIQDPSSSSIPNFHKNSINRSNRFFSREASIDQFPQNSPLFLSVPSSLSVQNFLEIVEKFTTRKKMGRKSRE